MSSILKALKKVEHDKASHRPEELKIDAEILRSESSQRFSVAGILAIAFLLLTGSSGITYLIMKHKNIPDIETTKQVNKEQKPAVVSQPSMIRQLPSPAVVIPAVISEKISTQPQKSKLVTPAQVAPPVKPALNTKQPTVLNVQKSTEPARTRESSSKSMPTLRVNGIAFQEGSSGSVAMINGAPVTSGASIEGVKVEEIHKDKVKFSYEGKMFEVPLGQSNQ